MMNGASSVSLKARSRGFKISLINSEGTWNTILEDQVNKLQQDATGRNNFAELLQLWVSDLQCSKTKQHPIMTRPWHVIWGWQPSELAKQLCTSSFLQSLGAEYTGWQLFLLSIQSFTSWILSTTQHILWHVPDHFKLQPYIPAYPVF